MKPMKMTKSSTGSLVRRLYVPREIARYVHDDTEFVPELTDEGILYRVVSAPPVPDDRPEWVTRGKAPTYAT